MKLLPLVLSSSFVGLGLVACSGESVGTGEADGGMTSSSSSGGSSSSSGGSTSSGSGGTGTLGGKPFVVASGLVKQASDGSVSILLADKAGLCASLNSQRIPAGLTLLQMYGLTGSAPGVFVPAEDDVKFARVASTCPSGGNINAYVEARGVARSASITLGVLSATRATGTVIATFENGESVNLAFDVPSCGVEDAEDAVCK